MTEDLIAMEPQPGTLGEMLRDSGLFAYMSESDLSHMHCVLRLAALIEARAVTRTREECADACAQVSRLAAKDWKSAYKPIDQGREAGADECESAIRALGERT